MFITDKKKPSIQYNHVISRRDSRNVLLLFFTINVVINKKKICPYYAEN